MLNNLSLSEMFAGAIVVSRVAGFMSFMPGISEAFISPRIRIWMILGIGVVLTPLISPDLPPLPSLPLDLAFLLGYELFIGAFLGVMARFVLYAVDAAGAIIAFQIGLSNVFSAGILMAMQSSVVSTFLGFAALLLIFTGGLHYLFLEALVQSYQTFKAGSYTFNVGDFTQTITHLVQTTFVFAIKLASPFLVFSLVYNAALGLVARVVPQIQVFFIAMPLQIVLGLVLLFVTSGMMLLSFGDMSQDLYRNLLKLN